MSKGRRYDGEPKLNLKKVAGVLLALVVITLVIICMVKLLKNNKKSEIVIPTSYYTAYTKGKFGVINNKGEFIVEAAYDEPVIVPNNSKALFVCVYDIDDSTGNYKTKVINEKKEEIITGYEKVEAIDNYDSRQNIWFEDNVLRASKNEKYGLIDFSGNELLPCEYDSIVSLKGVKNNFVVEKDQKVGLVNEQGQFIINAEYNKILPLEEEYKSAYIVANENNYYGVVGTNGKTIIEPKYEEVKYLNSSEVLAVKEAGAWKAVNENGEVIVEGYDDITEAFSDNVIVVKDGKYGVVSITNEVKIAPAYDELKYAFSIYYIAKQNGLYGIINTNNEQIIDFTYISMNYIEKGGFIKADKTETETVILDNNLAEKVTGIVSELNTDKGYIKMYLDGTYKYYNFKFEEKSSSDILTSNTLFLNKKDGKYGFVDKTGKEVIDYVYDDAKEQNSCGYAAVKKNGVWGSIDLIGAEALEPSINLDENIYIDFIGQWHLNDSGLYYEK